MAMRNILLDTNAYAAFKQGVPDAVEMIRHTSMIGVSSVVLGELLSGFALGSREAVNRQELNLFLDSPRVEVFSVDDRTAEYYAKIYQTLRNKGQPIPTNDMWIAATALQPGLTVFSYDRHFQAVDGLLVGTRLEDFPV